jgi:hypothetical protein
MNEFSLLREHNLLFFPRLSRIKIKFPGGKNRLPPKNRRPIKKLFLPIGWWGANLQFSGGANTSALNNFTCHCEPEGRGNLIFTGIASSLSSSQ